MTRKTATPILAFAAMTILAAVGCGGQGNDLGVSGSQQALIGDALPGTSAAVFTEAKQFFNTVEGIDDGLGPIFNERGCGVCHSNGASGGAGEQIERRYGRFVNGAFDPMASTGGSLRQLFSLGTFTNTAGQTCNAPVDVEPAGTQVRSGRLTTPLFGLGLVDAMPDSFFDALAAAEPAAVRGVVNRTQTALPNPDDASQSVGSTRVARFGWKANVPNLTQFAADAYLNEMGITTQHCFRGVSVLAFATENAPNGRPQPAGCDDNGPGGPGVPAGTDDGVGSCAGGLTEIQDDVAEFATFMTRLAPPPRDFSDQISIDRGAPLFASVGCAGCHSTATFRTPSTTPNGVPGNFAFQPFSDFLAHDMGALGDNIGINAGDSQTASRRMRTAPLWGIRFRNHLLHDGRTGDVTAAIRAHAGQGAAAAAAFNALSSANQHNVVQFVRSL
jgi:CxxC motif-containing protein (DUF1111 family)